MSQDTMSEVAIPEAIPEETISEATITEATIPEATIPEATIPESTILEATIPEATIPESTILEEPISEATIPEATIPEVTIPEATIPEATIPEATIPESIILEETILEATIPEASIPEATIPEETVAGATIPEATIPEETLPEATIPEAAVKAADASTSTTSLGMEVELDPSEPPCTGGHSPASIAKGPINYSNFGEVDIWLDLTDEAINTEPLTEIEHKRAQETWVYVQEKLKTDQTCCSILAPHVIHLTIRTLERAEHHMQKRPSYGRRKDEIGYSHVAIAALQCAVTVVYAVNEGLSKEEIDYSGNVGALFDEEWKELVGMILNKVLLTETPIACAMMDVLAVIGNALYCRLEENDQKYLLVFLLGYADTANPKEVAGAVRAKFGRCLAKLIAYESLRDDLYFFMDIFQLVQRNVEHGEIAMKIAYSWVFGNLTDNLVAIHMNKVEQLERFSTTFVADLLKIARLSLDVPMRGRYSSCRACGNVLSWLKDGMLTGVENQTVVKQITSILVGMIGNGIDYKLRWNAAQAVGHALHNDIFFSIMPNDVTVPILKALAKWTAQSQNYKERTQCVVSLGKAQSRPIYGPLYHHIWERVALSVSRLPVEEDCDSIEKFKMESVILIYHLISVAEIEDFEVLEPIIGANFESFRTLVLECASDIPLERLSGALCAKERLLEFLRSTTKWDEAEDTIKYFLELLLPATKDDAGVAPEPPTE